MGALWFRFRAEMRGRWRAVIALALLGGLGGAAVLAALAGARRTESAYSRMLEATNAEDFTIRAGSGITVPFDARDVARIPGVAQVGDSESFYLTTRGPRETLTERPSVLASGSIGNAAFFDIGRPKIVEGRMPRPGRADEILVSRILQRQGSFDVGERTDLVLVGVSGSTDEGIQLENVSFRIVGVGVTPDQIGVDEQRQGGLQMLLTPAFVEEHRAFAVEETIQVKVRPGADKARVARAIRALAGDDAVDIASTEDDRDRVERAVRPQVIALWIFGGVLGLTVLLVLGQAITRQLFLDAVDDPTLGALGVSRRQRVVLGLLRIAPVAVLAAVVALVGAIAASPLLPFGPARIAEPGTGVDVDALVLGVGVIGVVLVVLAVAVIPSVRLASRSLIEDFGSSTRVRSRTAERLARLGAPPTAVAGARFALEPGSGPVPVPTRATLMGAAASVTALVATIVVAANLQHVVDTPEVWGATWDVTVSVAADPRELGEEFDLETVLAVKQQQVEQQLDGLRGVTAWAESAANAVELDGRSVPALGLGRGRVRPAVVEGRLPRTGDEVALGRRTLESLGVEIGDRLRTSGRALRVVGITVLPRFQAIGGADEAALNRGAVLTLDGLLDRSPDFFTRFYLVRLGPNTPTNVGVDRIAAAVPPPFAFAVAPVAAPEDIEALDRVTGTPVVLAIVLAVLALAMLLHALVMSVRRRRRDLAILVALGFTRRQLRAQVASTVAWHAGVVTACSLVVAIPVGIALGRWLAGVFADEVGTVGDIVVPFGALAILLVGAVALSYVVAIVPGRLAARVQPALVLRSE